MMNEYSQIQKMPNTVGPQKYVIYIYQMKNFTVFNINIGEAICQEET